MKIIKRIPVPTGDILVVKGDKGLLEMLSLGDYGKDVNLKCDAMGLTRDIEPVKHTKLLPLEDKWVITFRPKEANEFIRWRNWGLLTLLVYNMKNNFSCC
jgi:hypothetical protein